VRRAVISLCDVTGNFVRPWAEAGYSCFCIDVEHSIRRARIARTDGRGCIHYVWGDVRSWRPPEGLEIAFVAAFPPCTHVAVSGARDFATKGGVMLRDALETFEACRMAAAWSGAPYFVENPVGVLAGLSHIGLPQYRFHPFQFAGWLDEPERSAEAYTKETCLWTGNGFVMPDRRPVDPIMGSKMHLLPPSDERAALRSATPMGFARAVFAANATPVVRSEAA
jgi:hypothetical protein